MRILNTSIFAKLLGNTRMCTKTLLLSFLLHFNSQTKRESVFWGAWPAAGFSGLCSRAVRLTGRRLKAFEGVNTIF